MKRLFSKRQRLLLAMKSGGKCENCGVKLTKETYHADHVTPWSRGGETLTPNGAALCAKCNLTKGRKMKNDIREWQQEARTKAVACYTKGERNFAIDAAPGAGKTFASILIAQELIEKDMIDRVIAIAPRKQIATQWKNNFKRVTKREMMKVTGAMFTHFDPEDMEDDIVATWQGIQAMQDVLQVICRNQRVLVIGDEVHHAALTAVWGGETRSALTDAKFALALTGTPNRSDGADSIWLNEAISAQNYYQVSYKVAVEKGWCVPVSFSKTVGELRINWTKGMDEYIKTTYDQIIVREDSVIIPPALEKKLDASMKRQLDFDKQIKKPIWEDDGKTPRIKSIHTDMLKDANRRLEAIRADEYGKGGLPNAGALIIAPNIATANYFDKLIRLMWPDEKPVVVNSQRQGSEQMIEKFARTDKKWIVSVNMVSEGVDIPRLRVLVMLPNAKTELYFRQAIGRIIRKDDKQAGKKVDPAMDNSHAYCVLPSVEPYLEFAKQIEEEMAEVELEAKTCSACGGEVERRPSADHPCPHCGYAPEPPAPKFWECSQWHPEGGCGTLNEMSQRECHQCGLPKNEPYELNVGDAYGERDGTISRGEDFDEEAVRASEEVVSQYRSFVLASGNQAAIKTLGKYPPEMIAVHAKLWNEAQQRETAQ